MEEQTVREKGGRREKKGKIREKGRDWEEISLKVRLCLNMC